MRKLFPVLFLACLLFPGSVFRAKAQESLPPHHLSVEAGIGLTPIHTLALSNAHEVNEQLASSGQECEDVSWTPAMSLSLAYRTGKYLELVFSMGYSASRYEVVQYGSFGTDPKGNPRYDLNKSPSHLGTRAGQRFGTLTFSGRLPWNPGENTTVYSGAGIGLVVGSEVLVIPELTIVGVRGGWGHFYLFAENTYGPLATLFHGGFGWRF